MTKKSLVMSEAEKASLLAGEDLGKLGEVRVVTTRRKDGSLRIQQDFSSCPTMTEQHTAFLTDINYLVAKYKPDELTAYILARSAHRREILGHDFSAEPTLQESLNHVHNLKETFKNLNPEIASRFANHFEFYKFMNNPANADKMIELGLMTPKEVQKVVEVSTTQTPAPAGAPVPLTPTTPTTPT